MRVEVGQLYRGVHDGEAKLVASLNLSGVYSVAAHHAVLLGGEGRTPEQLEGARGCRYTMEVLRRTFRGWKEKNQLLSNCTHICTLHISA